MSQPLRRPLAVLTWSLVALLAAGCSLFRGPATAPVDPAAPSPRPVATPAPPAPAPPPAPIDVEALIIAAAAEQTGYPRA